MRIFPLSDLHTEFGIINIRIPEVDLIILAGDVGIGNKGLKWIKEHIPNIPVIYVLGNHEYYGQKYPGLIKKIKAELRDTNIILLENDFVEINSIRFFGATLWSDYEITGNSRMAGYECEQTMTDFKKIRIEPAYSKIKYTDLIHIHKQSIRWLSAALENNIKGQNIVITHHSPTISSIPDQLKDNYLIAAYSSNLDKIIEKFSPKLWVHGHIHKKTDIIKYGCRIICNPVGYPDETDNSFDNNLIIEV